MTKVVRRNRKLRHFW